MTPKRGLFATIRRPALVVVAMALALTFSVLAEAVEHSPAGLPPTLRGTARIKFNGSSTLHDFSGEVAAQPFVLRLAHGIWSAEATVMTKEMTTANTKRDRKMWEMFAFIKYPRIHGTIDHAPRPTNGVARATLHLSIRGVEHDLPVEISQWTEDARALSFHAKWDVSLKAYGLKPPSVIGLIHVDDRVHVEADVAANVAALPTAANNPLSIKSRSKP